MAWTWRDIMEKEWLRRLGGAVSVMAHVALLAWVIFGSGVKLYDPPPPAINVELVPAKDAPAEKPGDLSLPSLDTAKGDDSKTDEPKAEEQKAEEPKTEEQKVEEKKAEEQKAEDPKTDEPKVDESKVQQAETEKPADKPEPPSLPQAAITGAPTVQPDVMSQYGDPFMSGLAGFSPDQVTADLKTNIVAAFRAHLKSCLKLPAGVARTDDAKIVLRVALKRDGKLARTPTLMAAKATPKGPLIMKAAIHALEACQPYSMLPPDKYKEWRELDLEFTPAGFG
jgi:hypothetical protein